MVAAGLVIGTLLPAIGLAQPVPDPAASAVQAADETPSEREDIIVTGTRFPGQTAAESPTPIDSLPIDEVTRGGRTDLTSGLKTVAPSFNTPRPTGSSFADFATPISLRGLSAGQTLVPVIAKVIAAAFLLWSAWKLWRDAGHADLAQRGVTLGRVFTTTLINPKGLVFAFAIFPQVGLVARLPYLGLFAVLVIATALGWMGLGTLAARSSAGLLTSSRVDRITAAALAVFATLLVVQTVQGML